MQPPRVHIVGAGLAGLATAVGLANSAAQVVVHEATSHAGGRCRSYEDQHLGLKIDNGNHLILSGNRAALGFLDTIGARDCLRGPAALLASVGEPEAAWHPLAGLDRVLAIGQHPSGSAPARPHCLRRPVL